VFHGPEDWQLPLEEFSGPLRRLDHWPPLYFQEKPRLLFGSNGDGFDCISRKSCPHQPCGNWDSIYQVTIHWQIEQFGRIFK